MKIVPNVDRRAEFFRVVATSGKSQVATMALAPGQESGEYGSEHAQSGQVLYVLSGTGSANVEGREVSLQAGVCLVIEAGERHRIVGGGEGLRTLNFYAPAAYPSEAD